MSTYKLPTVAKVAKLKKNEVYLVASGDLRLSANQKCWAAQQEMEKALAEAVAACGYKIVRGHSYKAKEKHGFIGSQREGMEVFAQLDPTAPLIVAEAVWQYSHHVLHGLGLADRPPADRRQLVGNLAGPGRHAQSERLAHQGRHQILHVVGRGLW